MVSINPDASQLENAFFAQQDRKLLEQLREKAEREERRRQLGETLNISNVEVLDALLDRDVAPETAIAFSIVPRVEVAWADGEVQKSEREAILKAAAERGMKPGCPASVMLESWLERRPDAALHDAWESYLRVLWPSLGDDTRREIKASVLGRAQTVAEAAGGFLGFGKVSDAERAVLSRLAAAFE